MLEPYDHRWPAAFAEAVKQIRAVADASWVIEHIGSTAVPGLRAKPIIDLAVRIQDDADFERHRDSLAAAGWRQASSVKSHRVLVRQDGGRRTHIAHFFEAGEWESANQRILRDWLVAHPEDRDHYEAAKMAAAQRAWAQGGYNAGKTAVIQEIVDRARAARGMPSVPVYDK